MPTVTASLLHVSYSSIAYLAAVVVVDTVDAAADADADVHCLFSTMKHQIHHTLLLLLLISTYHATSTYDIATHG